MTTTTDVSSAPRPPRRARNPLRGVRARLLTWYVGLLAVATLLTFLATREILLTRVDERIDSELVQETRELRQLAAGVDPQTGEPFAGRVTRIFDVFLARNVPSRGEALLTFVDGRPYRRSRQVMPYRLDRDPELVRRWARRASTERGSAETPAGPIEYLAVPLLDGQEPRGVFVVSIFRDRERAQVNDLLTAVGGVGLAMLLVGSLLAWRLAESVLRPVRAVAGTARAISETDLSQRIEVRGDDEIGALARTFNDMLDRIEAGFAGQRRFLADAGHELRTPLTIVRGHLELLGDDAEERRETIALVVDELERMTRIVEDLTLLAKAEAPDFLRVETIDVRALAAELHAKATALAPRKWTIEVDGAGTILGDRQRLTQAVVQLAQNAVQHTRDGDEIGLAASVNGVEARFRVSDRGPGIPPAEQSRIFDRFVRGANSRRLDGSGLGLAIVRAIADAHGGRVELDSRPGWGSTFTIVVPARGRA